MEISYLKKAYKLELISNYRKKSLSQKIRRDLLKNYILYPDQNEKINKFILEFNKLTEKKYKNVEDIFAHSYEKDFSSNPITFCGEKNDPTIIAKQIVDFFDKLNNKNLEFFLHGSHADGTASHYSDIDVSVFVKKSFLNNLIQTRSDILALNNYIRKYDLDSHHSIFLNFEDDKNYYPESFMPVSVLKKSITNKINDINNFQTRFSYDLTLDSFFNLSNHVLNLTNELSNFNSKNLKLILSEYFMIIILYEQFSNDNFNDKKTIFLDILTNKNKIEKLTAFQICSTIREKWPKQNNLNVFGISKFLLKKITTDILFLNEEIKKSTNYKKVMELIC